MSDDLTFTFAGDEAGDVGFAFGKGASRYFVMAVIATTDPDRLRGVLQEVRAGVGLPERYQFSFHALRSARLRKTVFEALSSARFDAWAVIVDKTTLADSFKLMSGLDFYLYFVTGLILLIPPEKRQGGTLILDEFGSSPRMRTELRRVMQVRGVPRQFRRVQIRRSQSELLIQVADLVAGALLRRDTKDDAGAFDYVQGKLKKILEYH
jgi:hypothetical protein